MVGPRDEWRRRRHDLPLRGSHGRDARATGAEDAGVYAQTSAEELPDAATSRGSRFIRKLREIRVMFGREGAGLGRASPHRQSVGVRFAGLR